MVGVNRVTDGASNPGNRKHQKFDVDLDKFLHDHSVRERALDPGGRKHQKFDVDLDETFSGKPEWERRAEMAQPELAESTELQRAALDVGEVSVETAEEFQRLGEEYRRRALDIAGRALDTADRALGKALHKRNGERKWLSREQVQGVIEALKVESGWNGILRECHLDGDERARSAAKALAECIEGIDAENFAEIDLENLRREIQAFRREVGFAESHVREMPAHLAWLYVRAADKISWLVLVGTVTGVAGAAVVGGPVGAVVVSAAVGAAVGAVMKEVRGGISRWFTEHSVVGQLGEAHAQLIKATDDLALCLPTLSGKVPRGTDNVRSVALATDFLVSHAEELASVFPWKRGALHREQYRNQLGEIRACVKRVLAITDDQVPGDISKAADELLYWAGKLAQCGKWIEDARHAARTPDDV